MDWLWENREWVFSGAGVTVIGVAVAQFLRRKGKERLSIHQNQSGGASSNNVQIGSINRSDKE